MARRPIPGKFGPGIRKAVELPQANGVETLESCEVRKRRTAP